MLLLAPAQLSQVLRPRYDLARGLVAWYTFDDGKATDYSGFQRQGTLVASPTFVGGIVPSLGGIRPGALNFNGTTQKVTASDTGLPSGAGLNLSVFCWIKTNSATATGGIVSYGTESSGQGFTFYLGSGHLNYSPWVGGVSDATTVNDNNWHHVGITISGGSTTKFYVDGKNTSTSTITSAMVPSLGLMIGTTLDGHFFPGIIDDPRVYNRTVSPAEANMLWQMARLPWMESDLPALTTGPVIFEQGGLAYPRTRNRERATGAKGKGEFATYSTFQQIGWPIIPPQPPHPRPERAGAIMRGNDGTDGVFQRFFPNGWPATLHQPNHPRPERSGAIARGEDGMEQIEINFFPFGWPIQPPPPPHPRPERGGLLPHGEDGNEGTFQAWKNTGWEVQPPQPPHPRPERDGAVARGDDGNEAPFVFWRTIGWPVQPPQPPHPRPERAASIMRGDDGTTATFITFYPQGWPVQPWQPPHPRPERGGLLPHGFDRELPLVFWRNAGWEVQPPQPPHPRPERFGFVPHGDDRELPLVYWRDVGWIVQDPQPPHPRTERAGSIMRGEDGMERMFAVFFDYGFAVQPWQPPHPRPERWAAAKGRSEFAAYSTFRNLGWPIQPPQPPHPRREKAGALMRGDDGNEPKFVRPFNVWFPFQEYLSRPKRRFNAEPVTLYAYNRGPWGWVVTDTWYRVPRKRFARDSYDLTLSIVPPPVALQPDHETGPIMIRRRRFIDVSFVVNVVNAKVWTPVASARIVVSTMPVITETEAMKAKTSPEASAVSTKLKAHPP